MVGPDQQVRDTVSVHVTRRADGYSKRIAVGHTKDSESSGSVEATHIE